jgi:hypothetical protein
LKEKRGGKGNEANEELGKGIESKPNTSKLEQQLPNKEEAALTKGFVEFRGKSVK